MNFLLSETVAVRLRDSIRKEPLKAGEVRQIGGMGETYFALSTTRVDPSTYTEFFTFLVDGVGHTCYRK
jgi:hypothetical protein